MSDDKKTFDLQTKVETNCIHKVNDSCIKAVKKLGPRHNVQCVKCGASLPLDQFVEDKKSSPKTSKTKDTQPTEII